MALAYPADLQLSLQTAPCVAQALICAMTVILMALQFCQVGTI